MNANPDAPLNPAERLELVDRCRGLLRHCAPKPRPSLLIDGSADGVFYRCEVGKFLIERRHRETSYDSLCYRLFSQGYPSCARNTLDLTARLDGVYTIRVFTVPFEPLDPNVVVIPALWGTDRAWAQAREALETLRRYMLLDDLADV